MQEMALRLLTALPFLTFANLRMKIDTLIVKKKERERETGGRKKSNSLESKQLLIIAALSPFSFS